MKVKELIEALEEIVASAPANDGIEVMVCDDDGALVHSCEPVIRYRHPHGAPLSFERRVVVIGPGRR
jgi:hypothetical protein